MRTVVVVEDHHHHHQLGLLKLTRIRMMGQQEHCQPRQNGRATMMLAMLWHSVSCRPPLYPDLFHQLARLLLTPRQQAQAPPQA